MTTPTLQDISAARTSRGGFSRESLEKLGVPWPPPKGWLKKLKRAAASVEPLPAFAGYHPEIWSVRKDVIYAAITAVESGLEYARECLATHDAAHGRTTLKNKTWAETMERDILLMDKTLAMLKTCGPFSKSHENHPS